MSKYKYNFLYVVGIVVVLIGLSYPAKAQSGHYSAASLGMGTTGTAYLDSYHANFVNPANIMFNNGNKPPLTIGLLGGISLSAGGPLANIPVYNDYFTKGNLLNVDEALDKWLGTSPNSVGRLGAEVDVIPIGVSWSNKRMGISLALRSRSLVSTSLNRGYAELLLSGLNSDRFGNSRAVDFSGEATLFSEISAGYSYQLVRIPEFSFARNIKVFAGIAPKFLFSHYTSSFDLNSTLEVNGSKIKHDFNYTISTVGSLTDQLEAYERANNDPNFNGSFMDFIDPQFNDLTNISGSGFGFDFGTTVKIELPKNVISFLRSKKHLSLALSVTDVGSISYDNNPGTFSTDDTFEWNGIDLDRGFGSAVVDSIAHDIYLNYKPGDAEKVTRSLPTKLNVGTSFSTARLGIALDLSKGLNNAGRNSKKANLKVGVKYKLFRFLPLRAGYFTGGQSSSSVTLGTGLDFKNFEFNVAALIAANSSHRGNNYGGAWSGLVFHF